MQKKRVKLFLVTMVFFLTATPALAAQPEIIWLESPAENQQVGYTTLIFSATYLMRLHTTVKDFTALR